MALLVAIVGCDSRKTDCAALAEAEKADVARDVAQVEEVLGDDAYIDGRLEAEAPTPPVQRMVDNAELDPRRDPAARRAELERSRDEDLRSVQKLHDRVVAHIDTKFAAFCQGLPAADAKCIRDFADKAAERRRRLRACADDDCRDEVSAEWAAAHPACQRLSNRIDRFVAEVM